MASTTTAGDAQTVTVEAQDGSNATDTGYLGTVHFDSTDGAAILPSDYSFDVGDAGIHVFTNAVTLKSAGAQDVTVTDTGDGTINGTASPTVAPAAATHFVVSGFQDPTDAGDSHDFDVTAKDQFQNVDTNYSGTVHFTSSDPQASLPSDSTLTNGTDTFSATLKKAGSRSITASDGSISGSQTSINVHAVAAVGLVLDPYPDPTVSGGSQRRHVDRRGSIRQRGPELHGNRPLHKLGRRRDPPS